MLSAISDIGVVREAQGAMPPKFVTYMVSLCFERRHPKQNTVTRLKSNILVPQKNFRLAMPLISNIIQI